MSINPLQSSPSNLRDFYNIPPRDPSKPISIGIYESGSYASKNDVKMFKQNYMSDLNLPYFEQVLDDVEKNFITFCDSGCSSPSAKDEAINIWKNGGGDSNQEVEASLDVQIAFGICQLGLHKEDKLYFFISDSIYVSTDIFTYLNQNKLDNNIPRIWSISYTWNEHSDLKDFESVINDLSKDHFQIFSSSGDKGSSQGSSYPIVPAAPATFPYITAVGGTIVSDTNNEYPSSATLLNDYAIITSGGGMDGCIIDNNDNITVKPEFNENDLNNQNDTDLFNSQNSVVSKYLDELSNATSSNINKDFITEIKNNSSDFYPRAFPNLSLQSINYPTFIDGQENTVAGTSASTPLMASIYAIIASNLSFTTSQYGKLNSQLFAANESDIWQKKVFKPVFSYNQQNDNNGATENDNNGETEIAKYSWNVAESRLSGSNGDGYGFDCVVGLGSINATNLMNYINCAHIPIEQQMTDIHTQPLTYNIDKLTITSNNMNIKYSHPADKPTDKYSCDTKKRECVPDASSTKSFTQCSSSCVADTYKCNIDTGNCEKDKTPQPDGSTYSMCHPVCTKVIVPSPTPDPSPDKYKCNTQTGHCEKTTDGSGSLLDDCNCKIKPPTYSCKNGKCSNDSSSNLSLCDCNSGCVS